jgi:hypothetical protein
LTEEKEREGEGARVRITEGEGERMTEGKRWHGRYKVRERMTDGA